jgi:chromosome segregation ATPase
MSALQPVLDRTYGLHLEQLTDKFARTYARTAAMTESFNGVMGSVENVKGAIETVRHLVEHEVHRHIEIINRQQDMLDNALREADSLRTQLMRENEDLQKRLAKLEHDLDAHRGSVSWRITRPLRAIRSLLNKGNT